MDIYSLIKSEFRLRVYTESFTRISQCVSNFSSEEISDRINTNVNSIGNLLLHLNGNVRQYIISGLGNQVDNRHRSDEFNARGPFDKNKLLRQLEQTLIDSVDIVNDLNPEKWEETFHVQCFQMTGLEIVVHVIEHFSYHTGQIALLTKILKPQDLKFYDDLDLEKKGK